MELHVNNGIVVYREIVFHRHIFFFYHLVMIRSCRIYKPGCKSLRIRASGLVRNSLTRHQYRCTRYWLHTVPYTESYIIVRYLFHLDFDIGRIHYFSISSYRIIVLVFCHIFIYTGEYLKCHYTVASGILHLSCKGHFHVLHPVFCLLVAHKERNHPFIGGSH